MMTGRAYILQLSSLTGTFTFRFVIIRSLTNNQTVLLLLVQNPRNYPACWLVLEQIYLFKFYLSSPYYVYRNQFFKLAVNECSIFIGQNENNTNWFLKNVYNTFALIILFLIPCNYRSMHCRKKKVTEKTCYR